MSSMSQSAVVSISTAAVTIVGVSVYTIFKASSASGGLCVAEIRRILSLPSLVGRCLTAARLLPLPACLSRSVKQVALDHHSGVEACHHQVSRCTGAGSYLQPLICCLTTSSWRDSLIVVSRWRSERCASCEGSCCDLLAEPMTSLVHLSDAECGECRVFQVVVTLSRNESCNETVLAMAGTITVSDSESHGRCGCLMASCHRHRAVHYRTLPPLATRQ